MSPLTPAVFHILLALAEGDRHGYAIMQQVALDSDESVKMGPGTLYGALSRMTKSGLVVQSETRVDPEMDDQRRIYYRLTSKGCDTLAAELKRYRSLVHIGRKRQPGALTASGLAPSGLAT